MFEGTLCFHPVWTVCSSSGRCHGTVSSAPWLVGVRSFALMSWQEVRKTPGRPIVNQDLVSRTVYIHSLPGVATRKQCPLRGRHGRQRGKLQSTTNPPVVHRQTAPSRPKSPVSSKTLVAQEKSKCALIDGQLPSSLRSSFSISRASTISRGHRRLNPPPPPLHPPISSFACTRHMELETNRAPVPLASPRPVLLPRKQPNGSRRERSAPARRVLDRGRSAVRNHYLILGTPPQSTCQILSCPSAKDVPSPSHYEKSTCTFDPEIVLGNPIVASAAGTKHTG